MKRHCSKCGRVGHDKRYHDKRRTRRNPRTKSGPSHDLFGERTHHVGLFGDKAYIAKPVAKKTAAEKAREAKRNKGQMGLDIGSTRSMFG